MIYLRWGSRTLPWPRRTVSCVRSATTDGIERAYGWRRLDAYHLVVVAGLSIEDALAGYREDLKACVAIGLGLTAMTLLVSAVLAHNRIDSMLSRQVLRAAVDNISQGLMVIAADRRVPLLNARAVELLDLPPHLTLPGFEFNSLLEWQLEAGEFADTDSTAVRTLAELGGIERSNAVYRRTRRNGTVLEVRTKVLASGLAVRTFTDITEQEHDAHALADARDLAQAAARARSEFLAVMSHEIRTPLNGVIGVAALLEDTELGPVQRDYVRLLRQSGDHLLELVNDILDFSRLEAERVVLEEVDFAPLALLQSVVEMFSTQAAAKGLYLSAMTDDEVPAMVNGDPGRLKQILLNLVSNAVKFTDKGWVSVNLTHESVPGERIKLLFSVADSGIGIEPEAIDRMFQEFTQMDGSISRRFGGSGLGLAICRRLVELKGGSIAVESRPGSGSTFRFDVAVRPAKAVLPAETVADVKLPPAPAMRILLAEDNPTNRIVALRMLERLGHKADVVANGLEVIAALERTRYDLVLMDVMMPAMDGLTATRKIRAAEGVRRTDRYRRPDRRFRSGQSGFLPRGGDGCLHHQAGYPRAPAGGAGGGAGHGRAKPPGDWSGAVDLTVARIGRNARGGGGDGDRAHLRRGHEREFGDDETGGIEQGPPDDLSLGTQRHRGRAECRRRCAGGARVGAGTDHRVVERDADRRRDRNDANRIGHGSEQARDQHRADGAGGCGLG